METLALEMGVFKIMPSLLRGRLRIWKTGRMTVALWTIHRHHRLRLPRVLRLHRLPLLHLRRHRRRQVRSRHLLRAHRQTRLNHHLLRLRQSRKFQVARMRADISRSVPCISILIRMANEISRLTRKQQQTSSVLLRSLQRLVIQ